MHNLIIGCGSIGERVAARAIAAGERVTGVVRSADSAARARRVGAQVCRVDLDQAQPVLPACERLFYCAPPPPEGHCDTRLQRVIAALRQPPRHVVYISTTGVYGDCGGAWVDEQRAVAPATARAERRVDAERRLLQWCAHAVILRAPGIYGPGRIPIQRIRQATPILADAISGWSNRIHMDDLAAMAWQAGQAHWPHSVYNACDGAPVPTGMYYDTLADLLQLPRPPRVDWATAQRQFSRVRLSFLRESRRVSNARVCHDLGYRFAFADYREGLKASLRAAPDMDPG